MPKAIATVWTSMPLVGRLLVIASLALTAAGVVMLYTVAREDASHARKDMDRAMANHLTILPATVADWIVVGDYSVLKQAMERYVTQEDVLAIVFRSPAGATVIARDQAQERGAPAWFVTWFDVPDARQSVAVDVGGRQYGVLEVELSAKVAVDRAWIRLRRHLAILALAIFLDFLGIWLVLRAALAPLSALHDGTLRIKAGELATRLTPGGDPELRGVMTTFNEMAATLETDRALLARDRDYLEVTLSSIGDGVITTDAGGVVEFMNPTAEAMTGWKAGRAREAALSEVFEILDAVTGEKLECPVKQVLRRGGVVTLSDDVVLVRHGDGGRYFVDLVAAPIRGSREGAILGTVLVFRDESEKRAQEYRMNLLASVVEHASESVVITDPDTLIIDVNQAFTEVTGYTRDEVLGRKISILKSGRHDNAFYERLWTALNNDGYWHGEIFNRRRSGDIFVEMASISAVRDARGKVTHYFGLFTDITLLKDQQRQLEHLAYYDVLTGLPNRRLLADRFDIALSQTRRASGSLAVCYLDLDGFKEVNDRYGHRSGDHLLVEVAERLKGSMRSGDTIARLGGDEFVLVLLGFDRAMENEHILDRILGSLAAPFSLDGNTVTISASIGVALCPGDAGSDLDSLLRHADHAMYVAKQAGRNRWHVFDVRQDRAVQEHQERRENIVRALNQGEFRLHYQPKVNMRSGVVTGAEALIRWQHPDKGLLSPAEFLPTIQDSELSIAVGDWVIGEAMRQVDAWRQIGLLIPVSVNISAQHMQHPQFLTNLGRQLDRYPELAEEMIEVEVLESSALDDIARASAVIRECRRLGVTVALDDFGTGYSSLTYLRRLPVSTIKIDQTFVRDMLVDQDDTAIVEGVISLAKAFQREVIAEGVETMEHGLLLLRMGCELGQGYGIARPMPGDAMPLWVSQWHPDPEWAAVRGGPWPQEDLPLLYASIAHRHWVNRVLARLDDPADYGRHDGRQDDLDSCAFGRWYESRGRQRYRQVASFIAVGSLHREIHALGDELLALHDKDPQAAKARVNELAGLRDQLLALLEDLRGQVG
ncbi:MAG: EAL domain-containing protein [Rhodocyclales bacterium]|nr:EAL domain-containing protein [Rhodocyclales bacterium]